MKNYRVPAGFHTLPQAIDKVGLEMLPDSWTGMERMALSGYVPGADTLEQHLLSDCQTLRQILSRYADISGIGEGLDPTLSDKRAFLSFWIRVQHVARMGDTRNISDDDHSGSIEQNTSKLSADEKEVLKKLLADWPAKRLLVQEWADMWERASLPLLEVFDRAKGELRPAFYDFDVGQTIYIDPGVWASRRGQLILCCKSENFITAAGMMCFGIMTEKDSWQVLVPEEIVERVAGKIRPSSRKRLSGAAAITKVYIELPDDVVPGPKLIDDVDVLLKVIQESKGELPELAPGTIENAIRDTRKEKLKKLDRLDAIESGSKLRSQKAT